MYVTWRPEDKYNDAFCTPKFRTYSTWTIHGSISLLGRGYMVVIEKEWGKLTGQVYRKKCFVANYN